MASSIPFGQAANSFSLTASTLKVPAHLMGPTSPEVCLNLNSMSSNIGCNCMGVRTLVISLCCFTGSLSVPGFPQMFLFARLRLAQSLEQNMIEMVMIVLFHGTSKASIAQEITWVPLAILKAHKR